MKRKTKRNIKPSNFFTSLLLVMVVSQIAAAQPLNSMFAETNWGFENNLTLSSDFENISPASVDVDLYYDLFIPAFNGQAEYMLYNRTLEATGATSQTPLWDSGHKDFDFSGLTNDLPYPLIINVPPVNLYEQSNSQDYSSNLKFGTANAPATTILLGFSGPALRY